MNIFAWVFGKKKSYLEEVKKETSTWQCTETPEVPPTPPTREPPSPETPKVERKKITVYRLRTTVGETFGWWADYLDESKAIEALDSLRTALTQNLGWWSVIDPIACNEVFTASLEGITYVEVVKYDYEYEEGNSKFDGTKTRYVENI